VQHTIRQYGLEQGALEVQFIEEMFHEFSGPKAADDIIRRLADREHLILLSMAPSPEDPAREIPVAFKVGHELRARERDPQLTDLVFRLRDVVDFERQRVFYSWIGGTREQWRGHGHYRALTEQQEEWAHRNGYHEMVVKTKNRFYRMRAALDRLQFDVIKFEHIPGNNGESKVYMGKKLGAEVLKQHRTSRVLEAA
jgi:GNAT superfamily N-acetyltransferase